MTGFDSKQRMAADKLQEYDQTALELCNVCGWKTLIPDDGCLNCERAQPAQEPVAWCWIGRKGWTEYGPIPHDTYPSKPLYAVPLPTQPAQEPVAWEWNFCERCGKRTADLTTIHTCTPPQGDA